MGLLVVAIVLVSGFSYTHRDLESRYKQRRASGWETYCYIATWGLRYCGQALLEVTFVITVLVGVHLALYAALKGFGLWPHQINSFQILKIMFTTGIGDIPLFIWVSLFWGYRIATQKGLESVAQMKEWDQRRDVYRNVVKSDAFDRILFEALEKSDLVLICLSSRKAYVGLVEGTGIEHADTDNVTIIPFISGYRDKDDLTFKEVHKYSDHYDQHSKPLSLYDFRTVIPRPQIVSVSLFDTNVYKTMKDHENKGWFKRLSR